MRDLNVDRCAVVFERMLVFCCNISKSINVYVVHYSEYKSKIITFLI